MPRAQEMLQLQEGGAQQLGLPRARDVQEVPQGGTQGSRVSRPSNLQQVWGRGPHVEGLHRGGEAECPDPQICNRCGAEGHMLRDCTEEEKTRAWTDEEGKVKEIYVPKEEGSVSELAK